MRSQRGSALITVVLVVFVLTMVGIAALFYMQTEDRISGTDRLQKAAFYAAEVGIRWGEQTILASPSSADITAALSRATVNPLDPPGGGWQGIPLMDGAAEALDKALPQGQEGFTATYSVYVRNNLEDLSRDPVADSDSTVNILCVGTVTTPTGLTVRKVIEEQMMVGGASGTVRGPGLSQKGGNPGSTGTIGGG